MRRFSAGFSIIVAIVLLITGCGSKSGEISKAQDFTLEDMSGNSFSLSDHSGTVIVLNFFATWCPPCRSEMPDFNEISREYAGKVTIIAVNVGNESRSKVQGFADKLGLDFQVAIDDGGRVTRLYGPIRAIPVTYLIDKDFNIAKKYIGARSKDVFVKDIQGLL
jgi:peroxiredoxin